MYGQEVFWQLSQESEQQPVFSLMIANIFKGNDLFHFPLHEHLSVIITSFLQLYLKWKKKTHRHFKPNEASSIAEAITKCHYTLGSLNLIDAFNTMCKFQFEIRIFCYTQMYALIVGSYSSYINSIV